LRYRWKVLSEERRAYFQKKALEEKEATKAKLNQQNLEEEALRKDSKKTVSPTNKKSSKVIHDVKIEEDIKIEQVEPTLFKRPLFNSYLPNTYLASANQFYPELINEYQTFSFQGFDSNLIFTSNEAPAFNLNSGLNTISNLLSYLPQNYVQQPKRTFDGQDFFGSYPQKAESFYVKDENIDNYEDEESPSTVVDLNNMTPSSHYPGSSRSQVLNDAIVSSLGGDDFKLECADAEVRKKLFC
jgi:hypothetical protein